MNLSLTEMSNFSRVNSRVDFTLKFVVVEKNIAQVLNIVGVYIICQTAQQPYTWQIKWLNFKVVHGAEDDKAIIL